MSWSIPLHDRSARGMIHTTITGESRKVSRPFTWGRYLDERPSGSARHAGTCRAVCRQGNVRHQIRAARKAEDLSATVDLPHAAPEHPPTHRHRRRPRPRGHRLPDRGTGGRLFRPPPALPHRPVPLPAGLARPCRRRDCTSSPTPASRQPRHHPVYGVLASLVGTLEVAAVAMLVGTPVAIATALFLSEYAPHLEPPHADRPGRPGRGHPEHHLRPVGRVRALRPTWSGSAPGSPATWPSSPSSR